MLGSVANLADKVLELAAAAAGNGVHGSDRHVERVPQRLLEVAGHRLALRVGVWLVAHDEYLNRLPTALDDLELIERRQVLGSLAGVKDGPTAATVGHDEEVSLSAENPAENRQAAAARAGRPHFRKIPDLVSQ